MPLAVGLLIALVLLVVTAIGRLGQLPQELDPTVALVRLPGYDYKAPDREAERKMEARFRSDTDLGNKITGLLLRQIVHRDDGSSLGLSLLLPWSRLQPSEILISMSPGASVSPAAVS
jgi:hypothetical protein